MTQVLPIASASHVQPAQPSDRPDHKTMNHFSDSKKHTGAEDEAITPLQQEIDLIEADRLYEGLDSRDHESQTASHTCIVAYHDRGVFKDVQIKDIRAAVEDPENDNQGTMEGLKKAVTLPNALAVKQVNWRIGIRRVAKGSLAVWSNPSGDNVLPSELRAK
ncbi:uncharacterized protein Z520_05326 [Fonsecaea multimorphosa CBS 102226]|uniref:Uncharacterized protein n=1 Tax=Fonsecaea multimorphosa CBS 102226 TaxID=1442371 RepID=A0A0D2HAG6_9EURO|nr:uncharacterized protein Z520_05326 [Fonsecaea multimorphosa CBS 102226]KIX98865.1 hypothetical protein Z520_05326 [Fonsecaea multimorphosa CBS 102226]